MDKPDIFYYFGRIRGAVNSSRDLKIISDQEAISQIKESVEEYEAKISAYMEEKYGKT